LIPEILPDMRPILFLNMRIIVLTVFSGAGVLDGIFSVGKILKEIPVKEFRTVIRIKPSILKGSCSTMLFRAVKTPCRPYPQTALCSVHSVAISTTSSV
jgi:hypothetical protein